MKFKSGSQLICIVIVVVVVAYGRAFARLLYIANILRILCFYVKLNHTSHQNKYELIQFLVMVTVKGMSIPGNWYYNL